MIKTLMVAAAALVITVGIAHADDPPTHVLTWGSGPGSGTGQFNIPRGLDASENWVYVTDKFNNRVQVFSTDGVYSDAWTGLNQPRGVAVDPDSGNVYVANTSSNNIRVYTKEGTYVTQFGSYGTTPPGLNLPMGLAVKDGELYIANSSNHRVDVFSTDGTWLRGWGGFGTGTGQLYYPRDLALDSAGNVYAMEVGNHRVQKFTSTGTYITHWGGGGIMNQPHGIAIDSNDDVYVLNTYLNRIDKYRSDGTFVYIYGSPGSGDGMETISMSPITTTTGPRSSTPLLVRLIRPQIQG
jgi:DNA-binding beta-propeller fold protein YncE